MQAEGDSRTRESFLVVVDREMGSDGLERVWIKIRAESGDDCNTDSPPGSYIAHVVMETLCYLRLEKSQIRYH